MRVTLDQQQLTFDTDMTTVSIDDALDQAARRAEAAGRVIVEVVVDGLTWGEDELSSHEQRASAADDVVLVSADLRHLVAQTLTDAAEALTDADRLQRDAAELIQEDRRPEGYARLGEAIGIWQKVGEAVERSRQALELDIDHLNAGGTSADAIISQLDDQLRILRSALENDDPVSLADSLLYDFPDVVTRWRELLDALVARVQARSD